MAMRKILRTKHTNTHTVLTLQHTHNERYDPHAQHHVPALSTGGSTQPRNATHTQNANQKQTQSKPNKRIKQTARRHRRTRGTHTKTKKKRCSWCALGSKQRHGPHRTDLQGNSLFSSPRRRTSLTQHPHALHTRTCTSTAKAGGRRDKAQLAFGKRPASNADNGPTQQAAAQAANTEEASKIHRASGEGNSQAAGGETQSQRGKSAGHRKHGMRKPLKTNITQKRGEKTDNSEWGK